MASNASRGNSRLSLGRLTAKDRRGPIRDQPPYMAILRRIGVDVPIERAHGYGLRPIREGVPGPRTINELAKQIVARSGGRPGPNMSRSVCGKLAPTGETALF